MTQLLVLLDSLGVFTTFNCVIFVTSAWVIIDALMDVIGVSIPNPVYKEYVINVVCVNDCFEVKSVLIII